MLSREAAHLRSLKVARSELAAILKKPRNSTMAISMVKKRSVG
jgi:hypothetical protein